MIYFYLCLVNCTKKVEKNKMTPTINQELVARALRKLRKFAMLPESAQIRILEQNPDFARALANLNLSGP